jgi:hypothetical protein
MRLILYGLILIALLITFARAGDYLPPDKNHFRECQTLDGFDVSDIEAGRAYPPPPCAGHDRYPHTHPVWQKWPEHHRRQPEKNG